MVLGSGCWGDGVSLVLGSRRWGDGVFLENMAGMPAEALPSLMLWLGVVVTLFSLKMGWGLRSGGWRDARSAGWWAPLAAPRLAPETRSAASETKSARARDQALPAPRDQGGPDR